MNFLDDFAVLPRLRSAEKCLSTRTDAEEGEEYSGNVNMWFLATMFFPTFRWRSWAAIFAIILVFSGRALVAPSYCRCCRCWFHAGPQCLRGHPLVPKAQTDEAMMLERLMRDIDILYDIVWWYIIDNMRAFNLEEIVNSCDVIGNNHGKTSKITPRVWLQFVYCRPEEETDGPPKQCGFCRCQRQLWISGGFKGLCT